MKTYAADMPLQRPLSSLSSSNTEQSPQFTTQPTFDLKGPEPLVFQPHHHPHYPQHLPDEPGAVQVTLGNSPPEDQLSYDSFSDSGMELLATLPLSGTGRSDVHPDWHQHQQQQSERDSAAGLSLTTRAILKKPEPSYRFFQERTQPSSSSRNRLIVPDFKQEKRYSFQERASAYLRDSQMPSVTTTSSVRRHSARNRAKKLFRLDTRPGGSFYRERVTAAPPPLSPPGDEPRSRLSSNFTFSEFCSHQRDEAGSSTRGELSSRVGGLRSHRNSPFSIRGELKTDRSHVKTEARPPHRPLPRGGGRGAAHNFEPPLSSQRTKRHFSPLPQPLHSAQTADMEQVSQRYSYLKQRQSDMLHQLGQQGLLGPGDVEKFLETTAIQQDYLKELAQRVKVNNKLQEELVKEKATKTTTPASAAVTSAATPNKDGIRIRQKFAESVRKALAGVGGVVQGEALYEAVLAIGQSVGEEEPLERFCQTAGGEFKKICEELAKVKREVGEREAGLKQREDRVAERERGCEQRVTEVEERARQVESVQAECARMDAALRADHEELQKKVGEVEAIYKDYEAEKAGFYQEFQNQSQQLQKELEGVHAHEKQVLEKEERVAERERKLAVRTEALEVEEAKTRERVKELLGGRLEDKKKKALALIREERVELERMRDKFMKELSDRARKGEGKLSKGLKQLKEKIGENEQLLGQIRAENAREEDTYAQLQEAETQVMRQIDSIDSRKAEVESAERLLEKREARLTDREARFSEQEAAAKQQLEEERSLLRDSLDLMERKKIELKANFDELNHRLARLQSHDKALVEREQAAEAQSQRRERALEQEAMGVEDLRARLVTREKELLHQRNLAKSERTELEAQKQEFDKDREDMLRELSKRASELEQTRSEIARQQAEVGRQGAEINEKQQQLKKYEDYLEEKEQQQAQDEACAQELLFHRKRELRAAEDALHRRERELQAKERNIEFNVESARKRLSQLEAVGSYNNPIMSHGSVVSEGGAGAPPRVQKQLTRDMREFRDILNQFDQQKTMLLELQEKQNAAPNFTTLSSIEQASPNMHEVQNIDLSISPLQVGQEASFNLSLKEHLNTINEKQQQQQGVAPESSETATFRSPLIKISTYSEHSRAPSEAARWAPGAPDAQKITARDLLSSSEEEQPPSKLIADSQDQLDEEQSSGRRTMVIKEGLTLEPVEYCCGMTSETGSCPGEQMILRAVPAVQLETEDGRGARMIDSGFSSSASTVARQTVVAPINLSEVLKRSAQAESLSQF